MEKAEVLNKFFCKCSSYTTQVIEGKGQDWKNDELCAIEENQVWCCGTRLDASALRKLPDAVAKPLCIIFDKSWWSGEVLTDWEKRKKLLFLKREKKEDMESYRLVSLTSVPNKIMDHSEWP